MLRVFHGCDHVEDIIKRKPLTWKFTVWRNLPGTASSSKLQLRHVLQKILIASDAVTKQTPEQNILCSTQLNAAQPEK